MNRGEVFYIYEWRLCGKACVLERSFMLQSRDRVEKWKIKIRDGLYNLGKMRLWFCESVFSENREKWTKSKDMKQILTIK